MSWFVILGLLALPSLLAAVTSRIEKREMPPRNRTREEGGSVTVEQMMWAAGAVATLIALFAVFKAGAVALVGRLFEQINGSF